MPEFKERHKKEELNFEKQGEKARQQGEISQNHHHEASHYHEPIMYDSGNRPSSHRNSGIIPCRIII